MKMVARVCFLTLSTAMIAGCHGTSQDPAPINPVLQARIVQSQQLELPLQLSATGIVHAKETAALSAQVTGRIQQVLVREGDLVQAGQTLVVLDDSALRASFEATKADAAAAQQAEAAAQANYALAASTLSRYRQLEAEKSVSLQEMDEVSRRAEAAKANLDAQVAQAEAAQARARGARTTLGYTRLVAPFAGVVVSRMADPGTMAGPGVVLLQMDHSGTLQLNVSVDESSIGFIHKNLKTQVSMNADQASELAGTVSDIVPAADPSSHGFLVKIDLPSAVFLHPGMYGSAHFSVGKKEAVVIPRSAVVSHGALMCVYALDPNGVAQLQYITLGMQHGNLVEVLSGIALGEKIVDAPSDREIAGKRIVDGEDTDPETGNSKSGARQ